MLYQLLSRTLLCTLTYMLQCLVGCSTAQFSCAGCLDHRGADLHWRIIQEVDQLQCKQTWVSHSDDTLRHKFADCLGVSSQVFQAADSITLCQPAAEPTASAMHAYIASCDNSV